MNWSDLIEQLEIGIQAARDKQREIDAALDKEHKKMLDAYRRGDDEAEVTAGDAFEDLETDSGDCQEFLDKLNDMLDDVKFRPSFFQPKKD